ncbi:poly(A) polymerase I-like [Phoenix dactylifera]|uniref:Poly(A) polymerase I-like n=1 Tax=Phoenix dactylifera TaxID=42345 RepID=A0A8B7C0Z4_PHODC|nr:poly(A) polymerase I-like [Phoenix dactylifera]
MAISWRSRLIPSLSSFSLLRTLVFELQRWKHTFAGESLRDSIRDADLDSPLKLGFFDPSTWRTVDSRTGGIRKSAISSSTWLVLKILRSRGFESYLVGGCVRDLLLKRTPKDFDVITTASLEQITKQFHKCRIIGRRFPICQVHILGSIIEVSSFDTRQKNVKERRVPNNCAEKDFIRWKNCMERDFTINGLFFDPIDCTIYDYVGGIRDLRTSKVRTVIPAHLSFKEDCARILRGLRIVARLGLRFSKETAEAIQDYSASIITLDKTRLLMELNFMLAYGAAESSIHLLQKFKLLEILLPFHAAYLADQTKKQSNESSVMLMKLFSNVDKLLAADRPSNYYLWLGLLAFHLALVEHPQDALVVWTLSSILYHGMWSKAMEFARQNVKGHGQFVPEILEPSESKSDELLLEETCHLASLVKSSVDALTRIDVLQQSLTRYPESLPCLGLVFVSEKMGKSVAELFDVLGNDITSHDKKRETRDINYELLKRGDLGETRFVLGKVIMDTMNCQLTLLQSQNVAPAKKSYVPLSSLFS